MRVLRHFASASPLCLSALVCFGSVLAPELSAQRHKPSFYDLTTVRNRPWAKDNWAEVRVGGLMNIAENENAARSTEDETVFWGSAYYRSRNVVGRENRFDAYVGIDGIYASITEGDPSKAQRYSRLEIEAKQWASYHREGFYDGDEFVPTAIYERTYWKARLSFSQQFESIRGEIGPFFGQNSFSRSRQTPAAYQLPDDHNVYGIHLRVEDRTLEYDQRTFLPKQGYIASVWVEREWNDSSRDIGFAGNRADLPRSVWRGGGHLEYYIPYTSTGAWIFEADGAWAADDDRIYVHDAGKPIGDIWVDARLEYRQLIGSHLSILPGIRGQWVQLHDEFFRNSDSEFFFGAQVEARYDFSASFAVSLEYSYLQNASREAFSLDEDLLGEHRIFFGVEFRP